MRALSVAPGHRLLWLTMAWCAVALAAAVVNAFDAAGWGPLLSDGVVTGLVATCLLVGWDGWRGGRLPGFTVVRALPNNLPVNRWTDVELRIGHGLSGETVVEVFDHYPDSAEVQFLPRTAVLKPGMETTVRYRLRPARRGDAIFETTQLLVPSPWRFWSFSRRIAAASQARVYPDFAAVTRYELLATDNRASQLGIKRKPRRGEGLDFFQLRDYRAGDSLRQIDWKASARRRRLISKEYQDERDQQLFFLLDCGRRMRTRDDHLSHFDHALNALLLLGYIALRQGDGVGLMSFSGERRWLSPQKSRYAINSLLNAVYDLHPTTQTSDFSNAAREFMARQRKRSLVVLMSNIREEDTDDMAVALQLLRQRHLVLVANLREEALDRTLREPVRDFDEAITYTGAFAYRCARQSGARLLNGHRVVNLDVTPGELAVRAVNSYWEIKRSGSL